LTYSCPDTQTNRRTCPGKGLWVYYRSRNTTGGFSRIRAYREYSLQARATLTNRNSMVQKLRSWAFVCVLKRSNEHLVSKCVAYLDDQHELWP
jgi:hypothetical protein